MTKTMIDLEYYPTWKDVEPKVRKTDIGYLHRDLEYKWVLGQQFKDGMGYLLAKARNGQPVWGELFMDDMLVMSKREATQMAKTFNTYYQARGRPGRVCVVSIRSQLDVD